MTWTKSLGIALDQLVNALFGGWPDETLSSRCWRWHMEGKRSWPKKLVDMLFFWEELHCRTSWQSEREGRQLPPELRQA